MTYDKSRKHQRVDLALAVEVKTENAEFTAKTKDLSMGGCCILSAYPLAERSTVEISLFVVVDEIENIDGDSLTTHASVQWAVHDEEDTSDHNHAAGLQFKDLSTEQHNWLKLHLQS